MQDRYAGDIGDFGKFALLRTLAPGRSLGVCWYRCSGAREQNNDGRHVDYLCQPERFRYLDPATFDAMERVVRTGRSLDALENCGLLPGATYHGDEVPHKRDQRLVWFATMSRLVDHCDLVFADVDNGFEWSALTPKCIAREEVRSLRKPGRVLVLYHHQTRRAGGASAEFERFSDWLFGVGASSVEAVRLRPYSSRFYVLVDANVALSQSLRTFCNRWRDLAVHFPRRSRRQAA